MNILLEFEYSIFITSNIYIYCLLYTSDAADERSSVDLGGTMRLGAYPAKLAKDSLVAELYGTTTVTERHRHRYEVNNAYRDRLEQAGLRISGTSPDGGLVEFVELDRQTHPYFVATQAHPELKSRPTHAHPLFRGLVAAAVGHAKAASKGAAKESSTKVVDK